MQPVPPEAERRALAAAYDQRPPSLATTIGVLLTDATLTKAQASRLATIGHDGMARAIAPVHSMMDEDTVFALASGRRPAPDDPRRALEDFNRLLAVRPMRSPTPAWMRCSRPRAADRGGPTAIWLCRRPCRPEKSSGPSRWLPTLWGGGERPRGDEDA